MKILEFINYLCGRSPGCLSGKTQNQKLDFFESLLLLKYTDLVFYNEQVADLLPEELAEFNSYILENHYDAE